MGLLTKLREFRTARQKEIELRTLAVGINSTVDLTKDMHIVMLDFDIDDIEHVQASVEELQKFWNLSDAELFKTKHGFHAYFWYDHVPYGRLRQIIEFARHVDPMFKYISRYYDHRTIRVAGKYRQKDIESYAWVLSDFREPTEEEREIGDMKRSEREMLAEVRI